MTHNTGPVMVAATNLQRVEKGRPVHHIQHLRPAYVMSTEEFHDLQMKHLEWSRKHLDWQYELFREEKEKWLAENEKEEKELNKTKRDLQEKELRWERKMLDSRKRNVTSLH